MANYDQFAAAVKELSGGKNVVLLDDLGLPSIYVPINKLKNSELIKDGSENIHPAFSVDSVEKSRFLYSKYQNVVINGRAYSLAHRDPGASITFDNARKACEAKGDGHHLATFAEWAAIALLTRKMSTMPHGNNDDGADEDYPYEKGELSETGRATLTGSGPATWGHDHTKFGIQDLNGNVHEWLAGMRLKDGEIQIIPNNDAALASCDVSATSALWKAMLTDGSLAEPGTADTLKYNYVSPGEMQLSTVSDTTVSYYSRSYTRMTLADGVTAPEIIKALTLYPDEPGSDYGGDDHDVAFKGERMPYAGGDYHGGSYTGVFSVSLYNSRSFADSYIGFRSAFFEP